MNAEIKEKWVKALRSGRYKQTTGQLEKDGAHCCLGVLCRVLRAPRAAWSEAPCLSELDDNGELMDRVGLDYGDELQLIHRNDGVANFEKHSFSAIADYIEAEL